MPCNCGKSLFLMTLHHMSIACTAQTLDATSKAKCAGHVPNKDVVTFNEMIFVLQQVEVAGVAAGVCGGGA